MTDNLGVVLGVSRRDSDIKQNRIVNKEGDIDSRQQKRRSDNVMANFTWQAGADSTLDVNLRYSSYEERLFWGDTVGNNFVDQHRAFGLTTQWQQRLSSGQLKATVAYDNYHDDRDSNSSSVVTVVDPDTFDSYVNGGYGDSRINQETTQLKLDYSHDSLNFAGAKHDLTSGVQFNYTRYRFERDQDVFGKVIFFRDEENLEASAGSANASYSQAVIYLEDQITKGDWSFRPGFRLEKDDYLERTNLAPRFAVNWQALDDTRLTFGANRYYGRSFAAMKLNEKVAVLNKDKSRRFKKIEGLKSPFSDELTLGINQRLGNFLLVARYNNRKYHDRLVYDQTENPEKYINGKTFKADIYTLQISNIRPWVLGQTQWQGTLAADYLDTDRTDVAANEFRDSVGYLDGKKMTRREMEEKVNSNSEEWTVRLNLDMDLPQYRVKWSNRVYVKAPVKGYSRITRDVKDKIDAFKSYDYGSHTQWDTKLRWTIPVVRNQKAYLQFEVLNVLNKVRRLETQGNSNKGEFSIYSPGRQFWLEAGYQF